jgi:ribosomal protein S18 acetylase RimI-like enzyme
MRMLVVRAHLRGRGIGKALADECIRRALRDNAKEIALHTSPIMKVALPMYERMGFQWVADAPSLFGVPYGIYLKGLG